jgi:vancomycin permeability regulator SanA
MRRAVPASPSSAYAAAIAAASSFLAKVLIVVSDPIHAPRAVWCARGRPPEGRMYWQPYLTCNN